MRDSTKSPNKNVVGTIVKLLLGIVIAMSVLNWHWIYMYFWVSSMPDLPAPKITYGEFPFRLEYELNGEIIAVEDVLVCEYDGTVKNEGGGTYRNWICYIAGNGKELQPLLILSDTKDLYKAVAYLVESPRYLMGEPNEDGSPRIAKIENGNALLHTINHKEQSTGARRITDEELLEEYGIEIISFEIAPPIENTFN